MARLYYPGLLFKGEVILLSSSQFHYMRHVLRSNVGDTFTIFNEREGEWLAVLTELSKTKAFAQVINHQRLVAIGPDVSLVFSLIKHGPLTFLVEKATELGVRHFYPVITERCNISRLNPDRLAGTILDAVQQCERFDIPTVAPLMSLGKALENWREDVPLLVCQERGEAPYLVQALQALPPRAAVGILVGPEGGLTPQEMGSLHSFPFTRFVNLGSRILRAETAALAALACYQAMVGDWKP